MSYSEHAPYSAAGRYYLRTADEDREVIEEELKDVSVKIHDGDIISVIGPSGAGKSTFIRCIRRINIMTDPRRRDEKKILWGIKIYKQRQET